MNRFGGDYRITPIHNSLNEEDAFSSSDDSLTPTPISSDSKSNSIIANNNNHNNNNNNNNISSISIHVHSNPNNTNTNNNCNSNTNNSALLNPISINNYTLNHNNSFSFQHHTSRENHNKNLVNNNNNDNNTNIKKKNTNSNKEENKSKSKNEKKKKKKKEQQLSHVCCLAQFTKVYSIQVFLIAAFVIQIAVICVLLVTLSTFSQRKSTNTFTGQIKRLLLNDIVQHIKGYMAPAPRLTYILAKHLERNPQDLTNQDALAKMTFDFMLGNPEAYLSYVATARGDFVGFIQTPNPPHSKMLQWKDSYGDIFYVYGTNTTDGSGDPPSDPSKLIAKFPYNITNNIWYQAMLEKRAFTWVPPYLDEQFPTHIYIAAVYPIYNTSQPGEILGVAAMDYTLFTVSSYLQNQVKAGESGVSYIIERTGNLVAVSANDTEVFKESGVYKLRINVLNSNHSMIAESGRAIYNYNVGSFANIPLVDGRQYALKYKSKAHGVVSIQYTCMNDGLGLIWFIVVVIPENDYNSGQKINRAIILSVSFGVALFSVFVSIIFSVLITLPLRNLGMEMERIANMEMKMSKSTASSPVATMNSTVDKPKNRYLKPFYEVQKLQLQFAKLKAALSYFDRYVPKEVVRILLKEKEEVSSNASSGAFSSSSLSLRSAKICVMFSDIQKFTTLAEQLDAKTLVSMLEVYFSELSSIILQQEGTLDKYIGDSIMAFWGMPSKVINMTHKAVSTAVLMQKKLKELEVKWKQQGLPHFRTRIGLNCGRALVGNIGSTDARISYTALGDTVNLASRLEALNKYYYTSILVSQSVYDEIHLEFLCKPLDFITVAGKNAPTRIYEVMGFMSDVAMDDIIMCEEYGAAFELYLSKQFTRAQEAYEKIMYKYSSEHAFAKVMVHRCALYSLDPPHEWDGVYRHMEK